MKHTLTNTTNELIALLEERRIEYRIIEKDKSISGKKELNLWVPSSQYLFELGQEYENIRNAPSK